MMKMLKNKKKKGFTLIELIAVVAIIGILAAVLVPKVAGYIQDAKKSKVIAQARSIIMAQETYNAKNTVPLADTTTYTQIYTATSSLTDYVDIINPTDTKSLIVPGATVEKCKAITEGADFDISATGANSGKWDGNLKGATPPTPNP